MIHAASKAGRQSAARTKRSENRSEYACLRPSEALGFIVFHAKEDIAHRHLIRNLIKEAYDRFSESRDAIEYGTRCFLHTFPLPMWNEALKRAKIEFRSNDVK